MPDATVRGRRLLFAAFLTATAAALPARAGPALCYPSQYYFPAGCGACAVSPGSNCQFFERRACSDQSTTFTGVGSLWCGDFRNLGWEQFGTQDLLQQGRDTSSIHCSNGKGPFTEECWNGIDGQGNGIDEDFNGCVDDGCTLGKGACTCLAVCETKACGTVPTASCDPYRGGNETCGNGEDDNCDGEADEGCEQPEPPPTPTPPVPRPPPDCPGKVGKDPILLATRSAITEPFTDFESTALSRLGITRTWSSADASLRGGPAGVFGRGWHHDWEGSLRCGGGLCTVSRGLGIALRFEARLQKPSLDGTETWQIYRPYALPGQVSTRGEILVRRPGGAWILFEPSGRELHFAVACDACGSPGADPLCADPLAGGTARLTRVVDPSGNAVRVTYDRPGGTLLMLEDDLGHRLEMRGAAACSDGLATELRHDGNTVTRYTYSGADLAQAVDAEGSVLRSYVHELSGSGLLRAVKNEAGEAVVEFSYDLWGRAIGVADAASSASVSYDDPASPVVTEAVGAATAVSRRTLDRHGKVTAVSDGCACGPAKTIQYLNRLPVCEMDAAGRVTWRDYDAWGRITRHAEFQGTCAKPADPIGPAESRDVRYTYGLTRAVAQGVTLPLDRLVEWARPSVNGSQWTREITSYDPAPDAAIDPAGYSCAAEGPLPYAAVPCRRIRSGYTYDPSFGWVLERHATFFSYDRRGRLVRTVGPVNLDRPSAGEVVPVEEREYWGEGESLARRGRLRAVRRYPGPAAAPLVTAYDHDAFGPFQITAPGGAVTTLVRDGRGRVRFAIDALQHRRETRYYDGLEPRLEVLASGAAVRYRHGAFGRLTGVEQLDGDPEAPGSTARLAEGEYYTHDLAGNVAITERRDAAGRVTYRQERSHDAQHRPVREVHPEDPARFREWQYDPAGFLFRTVDEEGRASVFTPDPIGRVKAVTRQGFDAAGLPVSLQVALYGYGNRTDALKSVRDPKLSTSYDQDDFGRVTRVSSNDFFNAVPAYGYDARGNLLRGATGYFDATYTYDGLDRVTSVRATRYGLLAATSYTFTYDEPGGAGRLTRVSDGERTWRYEYDALGRLRREALSVAGAPAELAVQYARDADGAVSSVTYPSGLLVAYERDPATRQVVRVVNGATGAAWASGVARLPAGPVTGLTFGNGLALTQGFNLRYQPVSLASGPLSLGYGMSPAGDVAAVVEGGVTRAFRYDFLDRLAESPGWLAYGMDGNGNRTSETVAGAQASYSYDVTAADRMTERRVPGATAGTWRREHTFAEDGTGKVGAVRWFGPTGAPLGGVCFRHDGLGRLVFAGRMTVNGTDCLLERNDAGLPEVLGKYRYDPQNRRVARWSTAAGRWSYTAFDGAGNPLSEVALSGGAWQPVRDYVWLDGKPLAQVEYAGGQESSYWLHADHLGLPRAMTNAAQQVVWSAAARPYGDLTETTTPDPLTGRTVVTNLRLPGQYDERLLGGLGLQGPYYNWNRWYLPGVGRYLELDPVAMKGGSTRLEWYAYAGGNPLRFIDPLGLDRYDFCRVCGRTSRWIERTCRRLPDFVCPYAGTYCCDMDYTDCMAQAPDADSPLYNVAWMRCNAIRALCIADPAHRQPADPTAPPRQ